MHYRYALCSTHSNAVLSCFYFIYLKVDCNFAYISAFSVIPNIDPIAFSLVRIDVGQVLALRYKGSRMNLYF